jgi:hypothetical protein
MLVGAAGALGAVIVLGVAALAVRDDLMMLRARTVAHERELAEVRRLAATLGTDGAPAGIDGGDEASLLARLEAVAGEVVGRERIASMTPATGADGVGEERVALRLTDASLAEVVQLVYALETGPPALPITHLELHKHADDAGRFDLNVEVARLVGAR